jgi:hypothetical protein
MSGFDGASLYGVDAPSDHGEYPLVDGVEDEVGICRRAHMHHGACRWLHGARHGADATVVEIGWGFGMKAVGVWEEGSFNSPTQGSL